MIQEIFCFVSIITETACFGNTFFHFLSKYIYSAYFKSSSIYAVSFSAAF